jgi:hypothetical protein
MQRVGGYNEAWELTDLIEQLRERLGGEYSSHPGLSPALEEVLARLVVRNQRLRVLHRLTRTGGSLEHIDAMRRALEQLDAELLQKLPGLLENLQAAH